MSETAAPEVVKGLKAHAGLTIVIGVAALIVGVLAVGAPLIAGISVAIAVGILLIAFGIMQCVFAFKASSFGKGLWTFLLGALTLVVGLVMVARPGAGLAGLTLYLAAYFVVEGICEIIWAFDLKPVNGWGWTLFSGIVSMLLGIMIWRQFPLSGAWAVGVLVGIKMIFSGFSMIFLGSGARAIAKNAAGAAG